MFFFQLIGLITYISSGSMIHTIETDSFSSLFFVDLPNLKMVFFQFAILV